MSVFVIILAAGSGTRFGGPVKKQFLSFHGKELWRHLYDTVADLIPTSQIVVVGVDIDGGATRSESVKKGLDWINSKGGCDRVVICEAARALVTPAQLKTIMDLDLPSCSFANPVIDTVVLMDGNYLNRSECRHLVSPQAFDFRLLYEAYNSRPIDDIRTDDTRLMNDVYGIKPSLLEGGENLYKVTYPKDIVVLDKLYQESVSRE